MPGLQKNGDHFSVKVTPGRVPVQAEIGQLSAGWPFCKVVHSETCQASQVTDVVGLPRIIWQFKKSCIGGSQRIVAQRVKRPPLLLLITAFLLKKSLQAGCTLGGHDSATHFSLVVYLGACEQVHNRPGRSGLWVRCSVNHPSQSRVQHGSATHRAWLKRNEEFTAVQTVISQNPCCRPYGHDFSMRGRIMPLNGAIAPGRNDLTIFYHHCANGHFARLCRLVGLGQGHFHE